MTDDYIPERDDAIVVYLDANGTTRQSRSKRKPSHIDEQPDYYDCPDVEPPGWAEP